jgi:hypothetical protein
MVDAIKAANLVEIIAITFTSIVFIALGNVFIFNVVVPWYNKYIRKV